MLPTNALTRQALKADEPPLPDAAVTGAIAFPRLSAVVLDTNAVLDWLVFGDPDARAIGAAVAARRLRWLATPAMLAELRSVLHRPLAPRWEAARELALTIDVATLASLCEEPAAAGPHLICRDPADQIFIDLACRHSPAVLLTRDRALLALRRRAIARGVEIASASAWCRRLASPV